MTAAQRGRDGSPLRPRPSPSHKRGRSRQEDTTTGARGALPPTCKLANQAHRHFVASRGLATCTLVSTARSPLNRAIRLHRRIDPREGHRLREL